MKKTLCLVFVVCLSSIGWAFTAPPGTVEGHRPEARAVIPAAGFLEAIAADEVISGAESISVDPDGSRLWSMQGDLSAPLSGDLTTAAREFVLDHAQCFNLPDVRSEDLLEVVRDESQAGGHHVSFQMRVGGYRVHDALIEVHLSADRRINLVHGSFPTVSQVGNMLRLSEQDAIACAIGAVGARCLYAKPFAELELYPADEDGTYVVAYVVAVPSQEPFGSFRVTLDAATGAELARSDEMLYWQEGKGAVYRNHPLVTPLSVERLPYLASTTLTGLYIAMRNKDAPLAESPDNTYLLDPSSIHFDEVNAYFHLNIAHDCFAAMGFNRLDRPIPAVVNYGDKLDNACYDAGFGVFGFGSGDQYYSFAREESILYHEYSHAVMVSIVKIRNADESGAMNEGQADYFGSSFSNDPVHGEYVASKAGLPYIRTLVHSLHYPGDMVGAIHKDGRIWAGALWDLRTAVGRDVADRLVHGSHFSLKSGNPRFVDGVNALLAADANLFGGKYKQTISTVMGRRGITGAAYRGMVMDRKELRLRKAFRALHRD